MEPYGILVMGDGFEVSITLNMVNPEIMCIAVFDGDEDVPVYSVLLPTNALKALLAVLK